MSINPRLARLIDLVPYIASHQGINIKELAAKFGVSVSELEKDLWLLFCCGLPGQTPLELMELSFEDGYVYVRNADELRIPRTLTKIEIATLVMGLEILVQEDLSIDKQDAKDTARSLLQRLGQMLQTKISLTPSTSSNYAIQIKQAIQQNNLLRITYLGQKRDVIPFEVYADKNALYLKAYCKKSNANRTFNLEKINELAILEQKEMPPVMVPSIDQLFHVDITVLSQPRRVRELLGAIDRVSYYSQDWLIKQVLSLGGSVQIQESDISNQILEKARAGKNLYLR